MRMSDAHLLRDWTGWAMLVLAVGLLASACSGGDEEPPRADVEVEERIEPVDVGPSANIALLWYADGEKRYIIAPVGIEVGQKVVSGADADPLPGNAMRLADIPIGLMVHNIEMHPGKGGQICRSAGAYAQLQAREGDYAVLQLPSGELRRVHIKCRATIGR